MGLDTYAVKEVPEGDEKALLEFQQQRTNDFKNTGSLIGGMMSGNGYDGAFRGKVYDEIIESVTGESLYQEEIDNETVKEMATSLEEAVASGRVFKFEADADDHLSLLAAWFRVAADNGYTVTGWW
jgi:hypothetical protein